MASSLGETIEEPPRNKFTTINVTSTPSQIGTSLNIEHNRVRIKGRQKAMWIKPKGAEKRQDHHFK
jgi:hypothetical protein